MEDFLANNLLLRLQIMIGILFFLFEFYDDQLLAFMVLILVWLSELFTLIRSLSLSLSLSHTHTEYLPWNDTPDETQLSVSCGMTQFGETNNGVVWSKLKNIIWTTFCV